MWILYDFCYLPMIQKYDVDTHHFISPIICFRKKDADAYLRSSARFCQIPPPHRSVFQSIFHFRPNSQSGILFDINPLLVPGSPFKKNKIPYREMGFGWVDFLIFFKRFTLLTSIFFPCKNFVNPDICSKSFSLLSLNLLLLVLEISSLSSFSAIISPS